MHNFKNDIYATIVKILDEGIFPNLKVEDDVAYIVDPVYGLNRNRVNAECAKTLIRINGINGNDYQELITKLLNWLIKNQNSDGSWNEIHVNENSPSALVTSFVAEAILEGFTLFENADYKKPLHAAKEFILKSEISEGFFRKSKAFGSFDYLNVDATCGAFLAKYGTVFSDNICLEAAERIAKHVFERQYYNGVLPYIIDSKNGPISNLQVPCIHYQGVTIYYLLKINDNLNMGWFDSHLKKEIEWLASVQNSNGRFDWSKSGLMFAYYLSGAYAFSIPCFVYGTKWNSEYMKKAEKAFSIMELNIKCIVNRWESGSLLTYPFSLIETLKSANNGDYPIKHRFFRFGYGMYRQFARPRYFNSVNPRLFYFLTRIMNIDSSTVEPENNYPDLFMTSEVLDCLSYSISRF